MLLLPLLPLLSLALPALAHPQIVTRSSNATEKRANFGFNYGTDKVYGVNLGGWLVTEPFIKPSLYQNTGNDGIVDEWTFGQYQDKTTAYNALKAHWDSWITLADFQAIAAAGLNHVRLPIGYWAFDVSDGEPYIQGQEAYMYKAVDWARQTGIKVIIDLHGAPGSQNGFDNSGHRGSANWATSQRNIDRTKAVVQRLSAEFAQSKYFGVVTAIAILNEPAGFMNSQLLQASRQFALDGYGTVRYPYAPKGDGTQSELLVIYHDAFQPLSSYNGFMSYPSFRDVAIDTHNYQVFSDGELNRDRRAHLRATCSMANAYSQAPNWLIVGEWSLAITDCARWLNGRGLGSRFDGSYPGSPKRGDCGYYTGSGDKFTSEYKNYLRRFWEVQTQTFANNGQGWVYWTWKTEAAAEWSYQTGLKYGWIPSSPTNHNEALGSLCA